MRRLLRTLGNLGLTVTAVLGVLCIVVVVAGTVGGIRPLLFRSGSMGPTIPTGSIAIAHRTSAADLKVGDIVSVPVSGTHITHRIVSVTHRNDSATLRLKGDANKTADAQVYVVSSAYKVWFAVPYVGYVIAWLSTPPGIYVLALYVALMLMLSFGRARGGGGPEKLVDDTDDTDDTDGSTDDSTDRTDAVPAAVRDSLAPRVRGVAAGVALLSASLFVGVVPTWAAWIDRVPVKGPAFAAYTVVPTSLSCETVKKSAVITISNVNHSYSYHLELLNSNNVLVEGDLPPSASDNGVMVTVTGDYVDNKDGTYKVTAQSQVVNPGTTTWGSVLATLSLNVTKKGNWVSCA